MEILRKVILVVFMSVGCVQANAVDFECNLGVDDTSMLGVVKEIVTVNRYNSYKSEDFSGSIDVTLDDSANILNEPVKTSIGDVTAIVSRGNFVTLQLDYTIYIGSNFISMTSASLPVELWLVDDSLEAKLKCHKKGQDKSMPVLVY